MKWRKENHMIDGGGKFWRNDSRITLGNEIYLRQVYFGQFASYCVIQNVMSKIAGSVIV